MTLTFTAPLTPEEFVRLALRTVSPQFHPPSAQREIDRLHAVIGLATEAAELAEGYADARRANRPIDRINFAEELGDILWYAALYLHSTGREARQFFPGPNEQPAPALPSFNYLRDVCEGLSKASAELLDLSKKQLFYGKPWNQGDGIAFLGAILYYVDQGARLLDTTTAQLMTTNIAKLQARYPEKFTSEQAEVRDLEAERRVLEGGTPVTGGGPLA